MAIKQKLKNYPRVYGLMLSVLNAINYFNIRFNAVFPSYQVSEQWKKRIALAKQSADNERIQTVPDAGKIFRDHQRMHNGLKITLGSYYDYGNTVLMQENKGVHEPQEEYVFQEILKTLPENAAMMELGSYWAFYSMWFASAVKNPTCIMVEPDPHKMNFGKLNFKLNGFRGTFDLGFIDQHTDLKKNIPTYGVDHLMKKHSVKFLHVLHSDIQGYEYKMLKGAQRSIDENKIGYIFISTHSNELHDQCHNFLAKNNFDIVCSANLDETYSWDGLLVTKSKFIEGLSSIEISKKKPNLGAW
jgi:hypothetical protein